MGASSRLTWRKSTYSSSNGGACIEVGTDVRTSTSEHHMVAVRDTTDRSGPTLAFPADVWSRFTRSLRMLTAWRKSTHSYSGGECVEVASVRTRTSEHRAVAVRDTKQAGRADRTVIRFSPAAWQEFTASLC